MVAMEIELPARESSATGHGSAGPGGSFEARRPREPSRREALSNDRKSRLTMLGGGALLAVVLCVLVAWGSSGGGSPGGGPHTPGLGPTPSPDEPAGAPHPLRFRQVVHEHETGSELTKWQCACSQDCKNPSVVNFMQKHGVECPAGGSSVMISEDAEDCRLAAPFAVSSASKGQSCITRDAAEAACEDVLGRWWSLKFGADQVLTSFLQEKLARDLRDKALLEWALQNRGHAETTAKEDVLGWVVPKCIEISLRKFAGGQITAEGGAGLLTDLFGKNELQQPPFSLPAVTYGHLRHDVAAEMKLAMHVPVSVGGTKRLEHPGFSSYRRQLGVPDDFLEAFHWQPDAGIDAGSGSLFASYLAFMIKCEDSRDWHSTVDWRTFHVIADEYFKFMQENPDSLLPRFLTAWSMDAGSDGRMMFCWAMQDWTPSSWKENPDWQASREAASLSWDLKGSIIYWKKGDTNNRLVTRGTKVFHPDDRLMLKDQNFVTDHSLVLPRDTAEMLHEQVDKDVAWLQSNMLMDYSFFLFLVDVDAEDAVSLSHVCPAEGHFEPKFLTAAFFQRDAGFTATVPSWDGNLYLWSMGLIDILQPWSLFKAIGTAVDELLFPDSVGTFAMNNIAPSQYGPRFSQFLKNITYSSHTVTYPNGTTEAFEAEHVYKKCADFRAREAKEKNPHLPFCEDLRLEAALPETTRLLRAAATPFTEEEVRAARREAHADTAPCQDHPVAVYVIGPSSVGKSTASETRLQDMGLDEKEAVVVDGDIWRSHHSGFNKLVDFGKKYNCVFKGAWDGVIKYSKAEKKKLFEFAADPECRRNMIVPETCSTWERCKIQFDRLKSQNYKIHVLSIIAPREDVLARGLARADKTGKHYSGAYVKPVAAMVPVMSLANGQCEVVDNTKLPSTTLMKHDCPNSREFDPFGMEAWLHEAKVKVFHISGLTPEEFHGAEKVQFVDGGSLLAESFCADMLTYSWEDEGPHPQYEEILEQLTALCSERKNQKIKEGTVEVRFDAMNPDTKGGSDLYTLSPTGPLKYRVMVKSLHEWEHDFWRRNFGRERRGELWERDRSYIVPFGHVWQAYGKTWGLEANALHGNSDSDYDVEPILYDIKGVPVLRYFKYDGMRRDPNWIADYSSKDATEANLGIPYERWSHMLTSLALDLTRLIQIGSIDYSLLVGIFDRPSVHGRRTAMGKATWWARDYSHKKTLEIVAGGIVDYLENATEFREGRVVGTDINRALVKSPGVYACRMLFFVATAMLAPCRWPIDEDFPDKGECIFDFAPALQKYFAGSDEFVLEEFVSEYTFLPKGCEHFDANGKSLEAAAAGLVAHADENLRHKNKCIDSVRAPDRCVDKFTYKGQSYVGCVKGANSCSGEGDCLSFGTHWCSWQEELPDDVTWDGPWSYCTPCKPDASLVA